LMYLLRQFREMFKTRAIARMLMHSFRNLINSSL
jgi:hypothetical protein